MFETSIWLVMVETLEDKLNGIQEDRCLMVIIDFIVHIGYEILIVII